MISAHTPCTWVAPGRADPKIIHCLNLTNQATACEQIFRKPASA